MRMIQAYFAAEMERMMKLDPFRTRQSRCLNSHRPLRKCAHDGIPATWP